MAQHTTFYMVLLTVLAVISSFDWTLGELVNCTETYRPKLQCEITKKCDPFPIAEVHWPGPPTGLTVSSYMDQVLFNNGQYTCPGLAFTWRLPRDASILFVKGFQITMINLGGSNPGKQRCYTISLPLANWSISDFTAVFQFKKFPIEGNTEVHIEMYSLPKPNTEYDMDNYVTSRILTPNCFQTNFPVSGDHVFGLNVASDSCNRTIATSFTIPPESFNFTAVDVRLLEDGQPNYGATKRVKLPTNYAAFTDVSPGNYTVHIIIVDDHPFDINRCMCKKKARCLRCIVTQSYKIEIAANPSGCPQTTTTGTTNGGTTLIYDTVSPTVDEELKYILGPIVGVSLAIVLIIFLVFILRKSFTCNMWSWVKKNKYVVGQKPPPNPPDKAYQDYGNHNNNAVPDLKTRVVYLLYTEDNDHHKRAVRLLAKYLDSYCHCRVMFPEWNMSDIQARGQVNWLLQAIQDADYVLIINSEGTYKLNQARKKNYHPKKLNEDILGDMFTPAVTYIIDNFYRQQSYNYKKYVMVQFENTLDEYTLTEVNPGYKYVLMKHIPELLRHIHEIQTDQHGVEPRDLPTEQSHVNYYTATDEGRQLVQTIKDAHAYVKTHPNWFNEMYSPEDENRFDSGLESLPEEERREIQRQCVDNLQRFPPIDASQEVDSEFEHRFLPEYLGEDQSLSPSRFMCIPPVDLYSVSTDHKISAGILPSSVVPPHPRSDHTDLSKPSLVPTASSGVFSYQPSVSALTGLASNVPTYQYGGNLSETAQHVPALQPHVCGGECVLGSGCNHGNIREHSGCCSQKSSNSQQSSNHSNDSSQGFGDFIAPCDLGSFQDEDADSKTPSERMRGLNADYDYCIIMDSGRSPVLLLPDTDAFSLGGESV